ncbi:hypothetical protein L1987_64544 [Smallanthus sonchifolius]|uniref:Uncharacterized protein n=1 Tax=Smallanthus sonchifolius TaxID=185202 RepID=A0ACB9BS81_9ASTR|nr:hypothetical protein L1987_64544 [Smallanthus sonchifolius]
MSSNLRSKPTILSRRKYEQARWSARPERTEKAAFSASASAAAAMGGCVEQWWFQVGGGVWLKKGMVQWSMSIYLYLVFVDGDGGGAMVVIDGDGGVNMSTKYPFPSHVSVQSFVTVKLSDDKGMCMYDLWKTQMLFMLESHDMLGFIYGIGPDCKLWKRSDALVNGWILGSLSEQAAIKVLNRLKSKYPHHQKTHFTSKDIWYQVQSIKDEGSGDKSKNNQQLYLAAECGTRQDLSRILKNPKVELTESISINGNTALHIAAANSKDGFLKSMLDLLPANFPLMEVRNSDGSTLVHLAASFGNTDAARILVDRSRDLLSAKDNQDIEQDTIRGDQPLVNAISYGHFDLVKILLKRYKSLKGDSVLMAIAQHCPADFKPYDTIIYKCCVADTSSGVLLLYPSKMLIWISMKLPVFNRLKEKLERRRYAREVLDTVCGLIKFSNDASSYCDFYTEPILETIRRDASDIVEKIVYWFPCAAMIVDEDAQEILPLASLEKNCFGETPEMVFTKEHKELVIESGNWMRSTANSYALTATLIITVVFAAAITVPGGNKENDGGKKGTAGVPKFIDNPAFIVFITSVAVSMVTSSMSLLLFLAILTSRYTEQDFFIVLPLTLVIALVSLFVSVTNPEQLPP